MTADPRFFLQTTRRPVFQDPPPGASSSRSGPNRSPWPAPSAAPNSIIEPLDAFGPLRRRRYATTCSMPMPSPPPCGNWSRPPDRDAVNVAPPSTCRITARASLSSISTSFRLRPDEQLPAASVPAHKKSLPYDVDSAAISYFTQPLTKAGKHEVVAVATPREVIARYEAPSSRRQRQRGHRDHPASRHARPGSCAAGVMIVAKLALERRCPDRDGCRSRHRAPGSLARTDRIDPRRNRRRSLPHVRLCRRQLRLASRRSLLLCGFHAATSGIEASTPLRRRTVRQGGSACRYRNAGDRGLPALPQDPGSRRMRVPINLASQPFRHDRAMLIGSSVLAVLMIASLVMLISLARIDRKNKIESMKQLATEQKQHCRSGSGPAPGSTGDPHQPQERGCARAKRAPQRYLCDAKASVGRASSPISRRWFPTTFRCSHIRPTLDKKNHVYLQMVHRRRIRRPSSTSFVRKARGLRCFRRHHGDGYACRRPRPTPCSATRCM